MLYLAGVVLAFASIGSAAMVTQDYSEMSIEDLMNVEITSVSKKSQRLSEAAAAIFVINQEDIRRSGATSIPEVLRMVPGVQVAHIDANKWAVTARGLNGGYAAKLLVMMDGRSVYSPLFSGVFWNSQDTLLEDIERIEVIRGPGATVWGANAVNGVINIITQNAADTQGGLLTAAVGTELAIGGGRFGGQIGEDTFWRIYAKATDVDSFTDANGDDAADDWQTQRGGFRLDSRIGIDHQLTLQGDIYNNDFNDTLITTDQIMMPPFIQVAEVDNSGDGSGGNLLGRWRYDASASSDYTLQIYYDRTNYAPGFTELAVDTFDVDFQHHFQLTDRQEVIWGLGYRFQQDKALNGNFVSFDPQEDSYDLWSLFVQDEILFFDDQVRLTVGSKFEHNDFTGFEIQPSVRAIWQPTKQQAVWAALSRAVRTASRGEHDVTLTQPIPGMGPTTLVTSGNSDFESEKMIAYEIGYRIQATKTLTFDTAVFLNDYDDLRWGKITGITPGFPPNPTRIDTVVYNALEGDVFGFEMASQWQPAAWLNFNLAYTYTDIDLTPVNDPSADISEIEGVDPNHQVSLRTMTNLSDRLTFDLWLRYVSELPGIDVDSYLTLDARLAYQINSNLEVALVGQNLLEDHHAEYVPEIQIPNKPSEVERSVYVKLDWSF